MKRIARHPLTAALLLSGATLANAQTPIPIDALAKVPDIQSVTMSADGKNLVAIVATPGSNNQDTALATWDLDNLDAGSKVTPSGDRMKFIAANAMKANRVLVIGRQEWTGQLGGCGEGSTNGATKTFVSKAYMTDTTQKKFDEATIAKKNKAGALRREIELKKKKIIEQKNGEFLKAQREQEQALRDKAAAAMEKEKQRLDKELEAALKALDE